MSVSDFAGAHWRRGWVKGASLLGKQSFPTAASPEEQLSVHCPTASGTALHCPSEREATSRLDTPEAAADHIKKVIASEEGFFPSGNHMTHRT